MKTTRKSSFVSRLGSRTVALCVALSATSGLIGAGAKHIMGAAPSVGHSVASSELDCAAHRQASLLDMLSLGAELYASSAKLPTQEPFHRASYTAEHAEHRCPGDLSR